jgi:NAD(P)-dependent dehydrogenase (short-subunit alcohol dehydrogenase family)
MHLGLVFLFVEGIVLMQGDADNLADLDRLFEIVKNEKGRIDVLFASAGFGELSKPLGSITEKGFDTFNVNVRGTLFTVQKALPLMKEGGVNHSE